jgi:hypothetical protein
MSPSSKSSHCASAGVPGTAARLCDMARKAVATAQIPWQLGLIRTMKRGRQRKERRTASAWHPRRHKSKRWWRFGSSNSSSLPGRLKAMTDAQVGGSVQKACRAAFVTSCATPTAWARRFPTSHDGVGSRIRSARIHLAGSIERCDPDRGLAYTQAARLAVIGSRRGGWSAPASPHQP